MNLSFNGDISNYYNGITYLSKMGFFCLDSEQESYKICVKKCNNGLQIILEKNQILIECNEKVHFFRALGLIIEKVNKGESFFCITEEPKISSNGLMLDCSRNAVATKKSLEKLIGMMALMGLNTLQLYTEDTYEIPEYPYFGYLRGRYTEEELKKLEEYAEQFGIELIPCIQTLAHLDTVLRWDCFVNEIRDCNDILLCDAEKTYQLIEAMVKQMATCFKSRKINIGMDEAHMMGLGKYLDLHGYQDRTQLLFRHLNRVVSICKKYGFSPMMWSDMFYRLACNGEQYTTITDEKAEKVAQQMPEDITPVYWDYYSADSEHYRCMMENHIKISDKAVFAGGAWKWTGPAPEIKYSIDMAKVSLPMCLETGIKTAFVTAWGDNGGECAMFSIMPVLQIYAEISYKGLVPTDEELSSRLMACTKASLEDFKLLDLPNKTTKTIADHCNPSKYLLFQDIASGLFDKHVEENFSKLYREYAEKLKDASVRSGQWAYMFSTLSNLCAVLEIKSVLGCNVRHAYRENDRVKLKCIMETDIPILIERLDILLSSWRNQWYKENKPQGFETINIRIGGIVARAKTLQYRLQEYLNGNIQELTEFQDVLLYFDNRSNDTLDINTSCYMWHLIASTNMIAF